MYYCLSFYPNLSPQLTEAIEAIRSAYDPTSKFYKPHITVVFPTHERVGEQPLIDHVQRVLGGWRPFEIRLGGLHKQSNHWLLLGLREGEADFKRLYREIHTGILADGRDLNRYTPHLSLGLFVKQGIAHDWFNPRESDFDCKRYEEALRKVEVLPLSESVIVDKLLLGTLSDSVIEWTKGKRVHIPDDADETIVREFIL
jgi:2'-5' RNA ligase